MPKRKTKNSTMRERSSTDGVCVKKMPKRKTKSSTTRERSSTDGVLSHERNWSELPQEILHLFSKKLPDISDFIRFRAVCKRWQLSAPVTDPPPQLPWLLERNEDPEENAIIRFYSLSSGKVYTITCPSSYHAWLQGPACRYLLASDARSFERHLLNPLTHDQIHVPFVNVIAFPNYIGPDPIEGGDIVVISGFNRTDNCNSDKTPNMMAFWRTKADNWVYVEGVGGSSNAFYMGKYFSNDGETGITNVIDIVTKELAYQVAPPVGTNPLLEGYTYIVESAGKILRLFKHFETEPCHFDIHCLYLGDGKGKPYWVKITDIGDKILFLQYNGGLSFCASNFSGFKGNCIYFLEATQYLCRYNIGDGTTELLPCPFDSVQSWFVPSLVKLSDINYA